MRRGMTKSGWNSLYNLVDLLVALRVIEDMDIVGMDSFWSYIDRRAK